MIDRGLSNDRTSEERVSCENCVQKRCESTGQRELAGPRYKRGRGDFIGVTPNSTSTTSFDALIGLKRVAPSPRSPQSDGRLPSKDVGIHGAVAEIAKSFEIDPIRGNRGAFAVRANRLLRNRADHCSNPSTDETATLSATRRGAIPSNLQSRALSGGLAERSTPAARAGLQTNSQNSFPRTQGPHQ